MTLNAKDIPISGTFERPPSVDPGTYPARIVTIATLGLQPQRPYKGEEKPPALMLLVTYELLDEFMKDEDGNDLTDKPRWITETFPFKNLGSERAKSTARYLALDPKAQHKGDWSKLISTPCMVTIVVEEGKGANAGKFYENVDNVAPMRAKEAEKAPELVNAPVVVDFYDPDEEALAKLPKWILKKMATALDYEGSDLETIASKLIEVDLAAKAAPPAPKKEAPKKAGLVLAADDVDDSIEW
jgi:hypothetical protein